MRHPDKPFCVVMWGDAHSTEDEVKETEIKHEPWTIKTYGWVLRSNEVGVTLAGEWVDGGTWRARTFIPRAMVIEETVLSLSSKRKKKPEGEPTCVTKL